MRRGRPPRGERRSPVRRVSRRSASRPRSAVLRSGVGRCVVGGKVAVAGEFRLGFPAAGHGRLFAVVAGHRPALDPVLFSCHRWLPFTTAVGDCVRACLTAAVPVGGFPGAVAPSRSVRRGRRRVMRAVRGCAVGTDRLSPSRWSVTSGGRSVVSRRSEPRLSPRRRRRRSHSRDSGSLRRSRRLPRNRPRRGRSVRYVVHRPSVPRLVAGPRRAAGRCSLPAAHQGGDHQREHDPDEDAEHDQEFDHLADAVGHLPGHDHVLPGGDQLMDGE